MSSKFSRITLLHKLQVTRCMFSCAAEVPPSHVAEMSQMFTVRFYLRSQIGLEWEKCGRLPAGCFWFGGRWRALCDSVTVFLFASGHMRPT